jgi:hypothetical protein
MERAINAHNVGAEHAAIWRDIAGLLAAPDTVAKGLTPDETTATTAQFVKQPAQPAQPATPSGTSLPVPPPPASRSNFIRRFRHG